LVLVYLNS